ncbi:MAG: SprT family zinc-dependent metalloprotease [Cyanobacteria bacterium J06631_9]
MPQLELFPSTGPSKKSVSKKKLSKKGFAPETSAVEPALPPYSVRESARAKHVSIKISVVGEVEIVVPPQFDHAKLPDILERRRAWINKTRSRLLRDRAQTSEDWQIEKPETIHFRYHSDDIDERNTDAKEIESWSVTYQQTSGNKTLCVPGLNRHLTLSGNTDNLQTCQAVLRKWLAHKAHRELAPWLRQLGFELDLPCHRISVRGQKTRWASCSSHKDISLNFKLLFLPRPLVHYVLVHELCHTVHMNHSAKFWHLVGEKQPDYEWRRKAIKSAWRYVPRWVETK